MQESAFTYSGGANNTDHFSFVDGEINALQDLEFASFCNKGLPQVLRFNQVSHKTYLVFSSIRCQGSRIQGFWRPSRSTSLHCHCERQSPEAISLRDSSLCSE